ncbi:MAG: vancomycin high temperature exclusion protein [Crocinitomix sp.]|nr:vancomycin high temperature exclusion protein [Crocinitomix sp.]
MHKKRTYIYLFFAFILMVFISQEIVIQQTENQIYTEIEEVPFREFALVLGTKKDGINGLNPYFKYRMDAAILLYTSHKISKIIVSGDNHTADYNETEDMTDYLLKAGIPANAIVKDYAGFRTLDSVVRAKKVFNCQNLTIVSQRFHNQRALFIANHYGLNAVAYCAKDVNSSKNYTHIREYFAKCLVIFDLYVFNRSPKFL